MASQGICFSPFQTGLLTGWGLFSTLRIYAGVPFALEEHWRRLSIDGERLHVDLSGLWPEVEAGFQALVEHNQAQEAVARVYCIRNRGGFLDTPNPRATDLLMLTRELHRWGASARLRLQPHGRHAQAPLAGTKTLTWAHNLVLVEEANAAGYDDVLLLNERGEVAECTSANVFAVRGGVMQTPPLDSGALPGVSRKVLLESGSRYGLRVEEKTLRPEDLWEAEDVFITSSTREVQAVAAIGERELRQGPWTGRAAAAFRQVVQEYVAAHKNAAPATSGSAQREVASH